MHTMKILLVEDDKSLREIYGVRLLAEGYDIISASDGEEALARVIKERPDLIISDVMMPKISGFDMLDIIRSTTETRHVKVIIMTALSSEEQRQRGESLGADRYLVKSQVGIEDVVRAVHEVLGDRPTNGGQSVSPRTATTPKTTEHTAAPAQNTPVSTPTPPRQHTAGERIIQPLQSSMPKPDYSSLIDDELSSTQPPDPKAIQAPEPPTTTEPTPFTLPPVTAVSHEQVAAPDHSQGDTNSHQAHAKDNSAATPHTAPLISDIMPQAGRTVAVSLANSGQTSSAVKNSVQSAALPHHKMTPADDEAALAKVLRKAPQPAEASRADTATDVIITSPQMQQPPTPHTSELPNSAYDNQAPSVPLLQEEKEENSTDERQTTNFTDSTPDPLDALFAEQTQASQAPLTMAPDEALANFFDDTPQPPVSPSPNTPPPVSQDNNGDGEAYHHLSVPVSERPPVEQSIVSHVATTPERSTIPSSTEQEYVAESGLEFEETSLPPHPVQS